MPTPLSAITEIINTATGYINWFNTCNPQWTTPLLTSDTEPPMDTFTPSGNTDEKDRPKCLLPGAEYPLPEEPVAEEKKPVNNLPKEPHENDYDKIIIKYAKETGVEPALIKAIIRKESHFYKNAKSNISTAKGLMQMLRGTAKQYGVKNPFDPEQIIKGGARLIKDLLDTFNGDTEKAILAYNQGAHGARTLLNQEKTDKNGYVAEVMSYFKEYKKCFTNT